jgi:hypothetical protein
VYITHNLRISIHPTILGHLLFPFFFGGLTSS